MTFHIALLINDNGDFYTTDSELGIQLVDDDVQKALEEIFEVEKYCLLK